MAAEALWQPEELSRHQTARRWPREQAVHANGSVTFLLEEQRQPHDGHAGKCRPVYVPSPSELVVQHIADSERSDQDEEEAFYPED